jgi:hypothetical protein
VFVRVLLRVPDNVNAVLVHFFTRFIPIFIVRKLDILIEYLVIKVSIKMNRTFDLKLQNQYIVHIFVRRVSPTGNTQREM